MKYTVIRDTREKDGHGWVWGKSRFCNGTVVQKLDEGDYSLVGYETLVSIERKGSITEFAQNIVTARFDKELERLRKVRYAFVLLECNISDVMLYPVGTRIPKYKWKKIKVRGPFILKRILEIEMTYPNISIMFVSKHGKDVASSIFRRIAERIEDARDNAE